MIPTLSRPLGARWTIKDDDGTYVWVMSVETYDAKVAELEKALAAADRLAHVLPHKQYGYWLDQYWEARGGPDACTVCQSP